MDIDKLFDGCSEKSDFAPLLKELPVGTHYGTVPNRAAGIKLKAACWDYSDKILKASPRYVVPGGDFAVPGDRRAVLMVDIDTAKGEYYVRVAEHEAPRPKERSHRNEWTDLREAVIAMREGESIKWPCAMADARSAKQTCYSVGGVSVSHSGNELTVTKNVSGESAGDAVWRICSEGGGPAPSGYSEAYIRSLVSSFNSANGTKMGVSVGRNGISISEKGSRLDESAPLTAAALRGEKVDRGALKAEMQEILNKINQ